jgi:hypothetical protein
VDVKNVQERRISLVEEQFKKSKAVAFCTRIRSAIRKQDFFTPSSIAKSWKY